MRIKHSRKLSFFYVAVICTIAKEEERHGLMWAIMINPPELPINDESRNEAHTVLQAQVCDETGN